jgi:hypothetical protein
MNRSVSLTWRYSRRETLTRDPRLARLMNDWSLTPYFSLESTTVKFSMSNIPLWGRKHRVAVEAHCPLIYTVISVRIEVRSMNRPILTISRGP